MSIILEKLTEANQKGKLLELVVEAIFNDMNLSNVKIQKSGSQYGYDVIGYYKNECWKAECKNLSNQAGIIDIAPKLVWHIDNYFIHKFIIVSVNGISNDLHYLLEKKLFSFPIEIWSGKYLIKKIAKSPKALKVLGINKPIIEQFFKIKPIFFEPNKIKFNVVYSKGQPYSFDYFILKNELIKAYTEVDFRLNAEIFNPYKFPIIIQEIKVKTLRYERVEGIRILRQFKQKGNIENLKLKFKPKKYSNGEVQLNEGNLFEVKGYSTEYIEFKLSNECEPGYYEIIFEINYIGDSESKSLFSQVFQLHKKGGVNNDYLNLCIIGKYYDSPVKQILMIKNDVWYKARKEYKNKIKYLGPTDLDTIQNKEKPTTWKINSLKGKINKQGDLITLDIKSTTKSQLLLDLNIPIEEEIYSRDDVFNQFYNSLKT